MKFAPTAMVIAVLASVSVGTAQAEPRVADPFLRADASFSRFPLNMPTTPQAIGRLINGDDCADDESGFDCEWEDSAGVVHVVVGDDILAIKTIDVAALGNRDISALGIRTVRNRAEVLAKVRAFLPEITVDCLEPGQAGEGEGIASCGGSFENGGWFKLLFGVDNRLTTARIDAFQIN